MPGPPPKPDAERRHRRPLAFQWTDIPATPRDGPPPALPDGREWPEATREAWADLWRCPQATQWDQDGTTMERWAWLHADMVLGIGRLSALSAEMRQIEDRHGVSPKAMLQLRWRLGPPEPETPPRRPKRDRWADLRVVDDSPRPA